MYKIKVDCHTHTLYSGHAYSTIGENVAQAALKGLEAIGISEHFGDAFAEVDPNNCFASIGYMLNMKDLPPVWNQIRVLHSVEADIMDLDGHIYGYDMNLPSDRRNDGVQTVADVVLTTRDYAIASVHRFDAQRCGTTLQNTKMYCKALENPMIQILGHVDRSPAAFSIDPILKTAKELGKIIEINNHSFDSDFDANTHQLSKKIAFRCAELGVYIAVNSDAHCAYHVGCFENALAMLTEIGFPQELIANESVDKFLKIVKKQKTSA